MTHPQGILQKDVFPQIVAGHIPIRNGRNKGHFYRVQRRSVLLCYSNGVYLLLVIVVDLIIVPQAVIGQSLLLRRLRHVGIASVVDAVVRPLCRDHIVPVRGHLY